MPGIVANKMGQKEEQIPPETQQKEPIAAAAGDEQATPEEQDAFERVEIAAMEILHTEQSKAEIMKMLEAGKDTPAETLGKTAMTIFAQIDEQSGGKIPEVVILQGALKVLDLTAELASASGIMQIDERVQSEAVQHMLIEAGRIYDIDPESLRELINSLPQEEVQKIVSQQQQYAGA